MPDADLARVYAVPPGALNRAVKRNHERFPDDFMFQLRAEEATSLRCQTGILKTGRLLILLLIAIACGARAAAADEARIKVERSEHSLRIRARVPGKEQWCEL